MKHKLFAAVLVASLSWAITSPAALIERDWMTTGDGLLTYDSRTGLEWLDITQTKLDDFPTGSLQEDRFQAVLAETQPGGAFEGFTVASVAQARELAASAGAEFDNGLYEVNEAPTAMLLSLLGVSRTTATFERLTGILSDIHQSIDRSIFGVSRDFESVTGRRAFVSVSSGYRVASQTYPNPDQPGIGVMLVRVVPEPTTVALVGFLVCRLLVISRRH